MVKKAVGKIIRIGNANTRYLTIPADVAKDDRFPFKDGEQVNVIIEGNRLVVEKIS